MQENTLISIKGKKKYSCVCILKVENKTSKEHTHLYFKYMFIHSVQVVKCYN